MTPTVGDWVRYKLPGLMSFVDIVISEESQCVLVERGGYWVDKSDILEIRPPQPKEEA